MGRVKTIARRSFLVGSAAIAGGVAFGYFAYKRPVENPLLENLEPGEAAFTPYVKIASRFSYRPLIETLIEYEIPSTLHISGTLIEGLKKHADSIDIRFN